MGASIPEKPAAICVISAHWLTQGSFVSTTPVPETDERIVIEGTVKSIAEKANDFGIRWVFTVEDDRGFRVWGTIPKSIDPSIGDRVRFTAKVERSSDDETFGFIKRPTKPEILPAVAA